MTQTFVVNKATQTISFAVLPDRAVGDGPFPLQAVASSGLPVSYRVAAGPATINGNNVTITGAGTITIEAGQPGNENYTAASPVTRSFAAIISTARQNQTISFPTLSYKTYTSPAFAVTATASSGLPVSFRVVSGPVSLQNNQVTITGIGSVTIEATQSGNSLYHAATPVLRSFTVGKASQVVTFAAPSNKRSNDPPFVLTGTASSGLPVQYRVVAGPATVSGATVTLTGAGTVTLEAVQPGDAFYSASFAVQRSFTITLAAAATQMVKLAVPEEQALRNCPGDPAIVLSVRPNPVRGSAVIYLAASENIEGRLEVYDNTGRLVSQPAGRQSLKQGQTALLSLDATTYKQGVYFVRFTSGRRTRTFAFSVM